MLERFSKCNRLGRKEEDHQLYGIITYSQQFTN